MIVHCDCNSFYASCHQMFQPELWDKPVVVMGNNGQVVVALNKKAKQAGIKRGMIFFQNRQLFKKHGVVVFESNYELYQDISDRVMLTLGDFGYPLEVSSIDEGYLDIKDYHNETDLYSKCESIKESTIHKTGIPVSLGVGRTKTLSKVATSFAKKYPRFNNLFIIDSELKWKECLKRTEINDVWNIGKQLTERLNVSGIFTAWDFVTKKTQKQARAIWSVELERTWCELQGVVCYPVITTVPDKKSITTSRSFPQMITDKESIKQAVATYAAICAADLRKQKSYAVKMFVSLRTNRFREDLPQYKPAREIILPLPSNTTTTLVKLAIDAVEDMFIEGFHYKNAEVTITKVTKDVQSSLFHSVQKELKLSQVCKVEDFYSHGFDRRHLSLAVMGYGDRSKIDLKVENPMKYPTTKFSDIIRINCND